MFGLPKSTEISKQLPKKVIFEKFKTSSANRKLFDEQINRLSIVAEISPQTVNIAANDEVSAVYIIHVILKTPDCDKKNIWLLSKLIDQHMIFALQYEDKVKFAVYRANRVLMSESRSTKDWEIKLTGLNLEAMWDVIISEIGGVILSEEMSLDEMIIKNERNERLIKQIATLKEKAMIERQPRRKWDLDQEIKKLEEILKGV